MVLHCQLLCSGKLLLLLRLQLILKNECFCLPFTEELVLDSLPFHPLLRVSQILMFGFLFHLSHFPAVLFSLERAGFFSFFSLLLDLIEKDLSALLFASALAVSVGRGCAFVQLLLER